MTKFEEPFPEDIIRLIVEELIAEDVSLLGVATVSPVFLTVCRSYLFRSLDLNINHINTVADLRTLCTAINDSKHGPQLAISITSLRISDHQAIPRLVHPGHNPNLADLDAVHAEPAQVSIKCPLGNAGPVLDKILPGLTNIRELTLSFANWFIPWERLSFPAQELLTRSTLRRVHLRGIEMLPETLSRKLLTIEEVSLLMCTFREDVFNPVKFPGNIAIRSLRFEPFGSGHGRNTAITARASPLHHWKAMGVGALKLENLTIILSSWVGIIEAAPILDAFKDSLASLSIQTDCLGLATNRPYQALVSAWAILTSFSLLRIRHGNRDSNCCFPSEYLSSWEATDHIHNLFQLLDKARPNSPVEERFNDGWFTRAMFSLSIPLTRAFAFKNLRTLEFSVSYWPNLVAAETNEELAWVCNVLADAPTSTAMGLEEIRVKIHVRTLYCANNQDVVLALDEYEGWSVWNEELCNEKWAGLKKVSLTIAATMVCCVEVREAWIQIVTDIRNGPLADINSKVALDVGFDISRE